MSRGAILLVGGATAVVLAVGGVVAETRAGAQPASSAVPDVVAEHVLTGAAGGVTAATVAKLESEVRAAPQDASVLTRLGFANQLRWRETADASYLPRSESP